MNTKPSEQPISETNVNDSSMPKKDRISLVISTLSLAVSLGTLALNRMDVSKAESKKAAIASFQAYELGDAIGRTFVSQAMTTVGDKQAIDRFKEQLATQARQSVQPIADRLDLRIDVGAKLAAYDPNDEVFGSRVVEDLRRDVQAAHGNSAARKLMLGYQLFYLYANTFVVQKEYPQDKSKLAAVYGPRAKAVNDELASMEISMRLPNEFDSFDTVLSSLMSATKAVRAKLAADRG